MKVAVKLLAGLCVLVWVVPATAEYVDDYEMFTASSGGTVLSGQYGYYLPTASTPSTDFMAYTYMGNPLGVPSNPTGGQNFVAGTGPGGGTYARAEIVEDGMYGDGTGTWTVSFDIAANYLGTLPTAQNLGSWSMAVQADPLNPTIAGCLMLAQWADVETAAAWDANYIAYNADGTYIYPAVPDNPAFQDLLKSHWYRLSTTFDFDSNKITEVAIKDLATGEMATYNPTAWYLGGGAAGGLPVGTGFRYFAGTSTQAGNMLAFDNMMLTPEPAAVLLLALMSVVARRR